MEAPPRCDRFSPPSISAHGFGPRPSLVALANLSNRRTGAMEGERMSALDNRRLQELAKQHLMMHFTRHGAFRTEDVPVIARGEGCWVFDSNGKRYFDGLSGLF